MILSTCKLIFSPLNKVLRSVSHESDGLELSVKRQPVQNKYRVSFLLPDTNTYDGYIGFFKGDKMNELMIFEGHEVEVLEFEGQVLFNARHVAEILDIKNVNDNISRMNEKQVVKLTNSAVGKTDIRKLNNAGENFLTESGVYKLVFKSHKPNAEAFTDWITDEVLPIIRKHGAYMTDATLEKALTSPDFLIQLATKLKEEQERNKVLEEDNKRMKPKEIFADAVSASNSSMLVRDLAKIIKQNGVAIGEKRFYKWLRENGYICKSDTSPTQKAMELGLFEVIIRTVERGNGLPIETKTTKVTGKGQQYFINKFLNKSA